MKSLQAFCVAAGIFLCLDVFHRQSSEVEYNSHIDLVKECINMLQHFDNSMIAIRGAKLLSCLLGETPQQQDLINDFGNEERRHRAHGRRIDMKGIVREVINVKGPAGPADSESRSSSLGPAQSATDGSQAFTEDQGALFPDLFPPQAGFSNSFLFDELFKFMCE